MHWMYSAFMVWAVCGAQLQQVYLQILLLIQHYNNEHYNSNNYTLFQGLLLSPYGVWIPKDFRFVYIIAKHRFYNGRLLKEQ